MAVTSLKVRMDCLALPMLYDISSDVYPHTGHLAGDAYRKPWIRGSVISTCKLSVNVCILDDPRRKEQPVHLPLERLRNKGELIDVVPNSDQNSQQGFDQDELARLLQDSNCFTPRQERFYKSTTDLMSVTYNNKDLLLEEVLGPLNVLKSHLHTLKAKLSSLSRIQVSDPLLNTSILSEDFILRHCAPYEIPPYADNKEFTTSSHVHEEFHTEAVLNHDSLLLPVGLEILYLYRENYCSLSIEQVLKVAPELLEYQVSTLNVLRKANLQASQLAVDISRLNPIKETASDIKMVGDPLGSIGHMVLSTALELDLPLTPPTQAGSTLLCLSGTQLPLEQLSPLHRPSLVSQRDQQEMELYVWKAEKHLNCVLGFLLTEPQTHNPAVEFYPVSNALKELNKEILVCVHASSDAILQSQMLWVKGVPGLCFSCCEFTENLTSGSSSTKEPTMEDFTALSPEHIENILAAQEKDSVPEVSIKGVKSILKKGVPSDQPAIPMNFDTSTCAVRKNKVNVVSQVHQSFMVLTNEKQIETSALLPAVSVSNSTAKETFLVCETTFLDLKDTSSHVTRPASRNQSQPSFCTSFGAERAKSAHLLLRNNKRSLLAEKDPDPLSTFMMLRSQQTSPDPVLPQPCPGYTEGPRVQQPTPAKPQSQHILGPHGWPMVRTGVVASHSAPVQETEAQPPSQALPGLPLIQDRQEGRVACVQATESVWRAYCELLAVAQPSLSRARELGLSCPAWGDFSSITPDQTRFVLRQQEKELCRQQGEVQRDKELLFNQTALIHVLVTFKDMMLQCDLITAVEYLTQAAIACSGQRLEQLVKRLQVVVYLSHRNQEPNPKLLELQDQLLSWLQSRHSSSDKVLILTTVDSDTTATIVQALNQATGEAATAICPEEGQPKLNGATVTNSVCGVVCVVACGQHIGADFPWLCFSLVVEYDRPGHSPWGALCKEKNIHHLCLLTSLPRREVPSACLEESVPFVLLVTDGLLNSPLLLQTLETRHNISVLERSYSPALQLFGGTQHYVIVTVNESTAIVIQDQEELGHAGYSERFVMRLTALSLQYCRCWLILHCPDSKAGGLSSEAFSSLVFVYSSLVLFGMRSEDLDVEVLMVSEVADMAQWVSRICFHSLMSSKREPSVYLDLHWLAVMPSEEDCSLLLFPCVNPLVSQLMLRRAPSLAWLLGAELSELELLLPEVPHKVLKCYLCEHQDCSNGSATCHLGGCHTGCGGFSGLLHNQDQRVLVVEEPRKPLFSDTTTLYQLGTESSSPDILPHHTQTSLREPRRPWTSGAYNTLPSSPINQQSEPSTADPAIHFLFREKPIETSYSEPEPSLAMQDINAVFQADQSVLFGGSTSLQGAWARKEPWQDEKEVEEEVQPLQSEVDDWIQRILRNSVTSPYHPHTTGSSPYHFHTTGSSPYHPHTNGSSPYRPQTTGSSPYHPQTTGSSPYHPQTTGSSPYHHHTTGSSPWYCVPGARPPEETPAWGSSVHSSGVSRGAMGISPGYGSRCWTMGLERKRSGVAAGLVDTVLPPLKRGRLGFEKVPGRCDGQTRLRFLK